MDRTLYLAHVEQPDLTTARRMINMQFVAYTPSQEAAEKAIRDACGDLCTITFRDHELPVEETVSRLGLHDGKARSLA